MKFEYYELTFNLPNTVKLGGYFISQETKKISPSMAGPLIEPSRTREGQVKRVGKSS